MFLITFIKEKTNMWKNIPYVICIPSGVLVHMAEAHQVSFLCLFIQLQQVEVQTVLVVRNYNSYCNNGMYS
jgi:hypothetical protein